jgi:hypothetical protein
MNSQNGIYKKLGVLVVMETLLLSLTTLAMAESDAVRAIYLKCSMSKVSEMSSSPSVPAANRSMSLSKNSISFFPMDRHTLAFPSR